MNKSHTFLPDGYREAARIDLDNDQKLATRINMSSLMVMVPFAMVLLIMYVNGGAVSFDMGLNGWLTFVVAMVLVMLVHELVHGLFFRIFSPNGKVKFGVNSMMAYAGNPDAYYSRGVFTVIALAPAVIIDIALIASLLFLRDTTFYLAYMVLAIHTGGCVGDFYAVKTAHKLKGDVLVCDTGTMQTFYCK